jgi:sugar lactone lactonase YvrE
MDKLLRRALIMAALFGFAGCGGGMTSQPSSLASQGAPAFVHSGVPVAPPLMLRAFGHKSTSGKYPTKKSLLFEGDEDEAAVNIYQTAALAKNPAPIATIHVAHGCPYGVATDKKGTIYVADNCGSGSFVGDVEEFPKGSTTLKTTITEGISYPIGMAIDKSGTLYVTGYNPASISEYPAGATSPSKVVTGGGLTDPAGIALDGSGNLYIADFGATAVFELPAGGSSVTNLGLQDLGEPIAVAVDVKTGDLWETGGSGDAINVYQLRSSTSPIKTITGDGFPYAIGSENKGKPKGEIVESDIDTHAVYAFAPGSYTPYATLTNGIEQPTGLLITRP